MYSVDNKKWYMLPHMHLQRGSSPAMFILQNKLYILGQGGYLTNITENIEVFYLSLLIVIHITTKVGLDLTRQLNKC